MSIIDDDHLCLKPRGIGSANYRMMKPCHNFCKNRIKNKSLAEPTLPSLVLLSCHDSKKYQAALRLKKRIAENPAAFPDMGSLAEGFEAREVDKFGEIAAKCVRRVQKRLTTEEIKMLIVEYQGGKTPSELSEKYGCHRITVGKILRRNGIEIRPPYSGRQEKTPVAEPEDYVGSP